MAYRDYIEALTIFDKYENSGFFHAEHDELYGGPNPDVVSDEDKARLELLGWSDDSKNSGSFHHFV